MALPASSTILLSIPVAEGAHVFLEDRSRARGMASRVAKEGGDGFVGLCHVVVEPPRQADEFGGIVGEVGAGAVVSQAETALDGAQEVVGVAELGVDISSEDASAVQGIECIPQVRTEEIGLFSRVDQDQVLDNELEVGQPAESPLEVVSSARFLELPTHGDNLS